jgi:hypothetical protein
MAQQHTVRTVHEHGIKLTAAQRKLRAAIKRAATEARQAQEAAAIVASAAGQSGQ